MPEIEAIVQEELERFHIHGAAVAVVKDGEIVLARGFGYRDAEQQLPTTGRTLFPIGSTTKAFTAAAVGAAVDDGLLEWDRPVREYLPTFELYDPVAGRELTLRDMLSHRSGLPRHDRMMLMYAGGGLTRAESVERLRYLQPNKGFREAWQYNNLIYMAAGYVIEAVTGRTWEEAVQEKLLDPLGLANTNLFMAELQKSDDHAVGYTERDGSLVEVPYRSIEVVGPAGSINSCIEDMARWVLVNIDQGRLEGKQVLSPATVKEIQSPTILIPDSPLWSEVDLIGYGLGWVVENRRGHRVIWHNGGIDGFKTFIAFSSEQMAGVVVLANSFPSEAPEAISYRVIEQLLGLDPLPWGERYHEIDQTAAAGAKETREHRRSKSKDAPPTHPLEDFAGAYSHPGYGRISFEVVGDELVADLHDLSVTLEHRHFNVRDAHDKRLDQTIPFVFATDADGEIARLEARLEPTVDPIVFEKEPDPALFDPIYLERFTGTYEFGAFKLEVSLKGSTLTASGPALGSFELEPRLGKTRFGAKGQQDLSLEYVLDGGSSATELVVEPVGVFKKVG